MSEQIEVEGLLSSLSDPAVLQLLNNGSAASLNENLQQLQ